MTTAAICLHGFVLLSIAHSVPLPRRLRAQSSPSPSLSRRAVLAEIARTHARTQVESEDSQHPAPSFIVTCNKVSSNSDPCLPWHLTWPRVPLPLPLTAPRLRTRARTRALVSLASRRQTSSVHAVASHPPLPRASPSLQDSSLPSVKPQPFLVLGAFCDPRSLPRLRRAGAYSYSYHTFSVLTILLPHSFSHHHHHHHHRCVLRHRSVIVYHQSPDANLADPTSGRPTHSPQLHPR